MKNFVVTNRKTSKGFTLIELMIGCMIIMLLATVAITAFQGYQARSKATEAVMALNKMVLGETEYYGKMSVFLDAGPANIPPVGPKTTVDFVTDPAWRSINFQFMSGVYFGYEAVTSGTQAVACRAVGDLDYDGATSLYQRNLTATNGSVSPGGLFYFDEIE